MSLRMSCHVQELGDVPPSDPSNNIGHCSSCYSELLPDYFGMDTTHCKCAYLRDGSSSEFRRRITFAKRASAFVSHILRVFAFGSDKEMVRIETSGVVAFVTNGQLRLQIKPKIQMCRDSVNLIDGMANSDFAVSEWACSASPLPTIGFRANHSAAKHPIFYALGLFGNSASNRACRSTATKNFGMFARERLSALRTRKLDPRFRSRIRWHRNLQCFGDWPGVFAALPGFSSLLNYTSSSLHLMKETPCLND